MYNKLMGLVFTIVGMFLVLGAIGAFANNWPLTKILIVSGIQLLIALFPLSIGIKLLSKKAKIHSEEQ